MCIVILKSVSFMASVSVLNPYVCYLPVSSDSFRTGRDEFTQLVALPEKGKIIIG